MQNSLGLGISFREQLSPNKPSEELGKPLQNPAEALCAHSLPKTLQKLVRKISDSTSEEKFRVWE